jgi:cobalt-zinc-cadmium efflux system outer membrane protein
VSGRTVEDLVTQALRTNGDILVSQQMVAAAQGNLVQARLRPNPSLDISGMQELAGPMNNFTVGASIPLELFGRRDRRVEVAQRAVTMTEFEQADAGRRLRAEIASRFGEILAAAQTLEFTRELLKLNRDALQLIEARAEKGASPTLDANLSRVEVNRLDSLRVDAEARVEVAALELKSLVGLKPGEPLRLRGTLAVEPALTEAAATSTALENRPDLRALREAEQVADARVRQAQADARPNASLSGSYQRADSSFPQNGLTPQGTITRVQGIFHLATVGVSITLPTRNRNEGTIRSAVADLEAAKRRREYAEAIAAREVAAAQLQQQKAKEGLDIFGPGVRDQTRQNLAVIRRVYELGRSQQLDVIAEQRRLIDAETGYVEALNRYYQATVRLRLALGKE